MKKESRAFVNDLLASRSERSEFEGEYAGQWPTFTEETLARFRDHRDRLINRLAVILMKKPSSRFVEVPFPPGERDFVVFDTELRIFTEARVKVLDHVVHGEEMYWVQPESFRTLVVMIPRELS